MNRRNLSSLIAIALAGALPWVAHAQESRLDRIARTGTLVVAHAEVGVPFSYVAAEGPVGFGVDISKAVADAIRQHLQLPALKIRWNPVTLSTRFPLMVSNTVDLECITTTNTRARQAMVAFSNTFYLSEEGMAVRKDSGIAGRADLAGKRVAVVRGTTTEKSLSDVPGVALVVERNNRLAMAALAEGRADAYVAGNAIVAGEMLRLKDAAALKIVATGGLREAFGCMLPKDDPAFKKVVDDALARLMTSGQMEGLYNKWFMGPVPPYGRTVGLPLTNENRKLYANPNDQALE